MASGYAAGGIVNRFFRLAHCPTSGILLLTAPHSKVHKYALLSLDELKADTFLHADIRETARPMIPWVNFCKDGYTIKFHAQLAWLKAEFLR